MDLSELVKDWGEFEKFVAELNETGDVDVQHNVTLVGRSGAPRQVDVLIRHTVGLYEHLIIAECKYWKSQVERLHVDALSTAVKELGASKGVIFSTKGFQSGALTQAEHDGIDLFSIRELTYEEWGLPGRNVEIFMQVNSISIANLKIHVAVPIRNPQPESSSLALHLGDVNRTSTPIEWQGKPPHSTSK